jgi:ceramide glucosyltransferase
LLAVIGALQAAIGAWLAARFLRAPAPAPAERPAVSLLKPLYGDEPGLEAALESNLRLAYPDVQFVFGAHSANDPALAVLARLRARHPGADIAVVVNPARHGSNGKISNLINMLPAAKHDVLVVSDADVHVAPDYLDHVVAALAPPGVGLVTTLYGGVATTAALAGRLGAAAITLGFLPGVLMSRALGHADCLGATMALRRTTLAAIGGFAALADHIADDHLLGVLVRRAGLRVALAHTVPLTSVPETSLAALWRHELRWARTIRALVPVQFALSLLQYELAWALLALCLCPAGWTLGLFAGLWLAAWASQRAIEAALAPVRPSRTPFWLLPARDLLSFATTLASYVSNRVDWRGHTLHTAALPARAASFGTELS